MKIFKIEKLNPVMTGTSAKGEWKSRTMVLEAVDEGDVIYPSRLIVEIRNDKVDKFPYHEGDTFKPFLHFSTHEYNGKDYQNVQLIRWAEDDRKF